MKISKDKKYKTRNGFDVKIYEVYEDKVHAAYLLGETWICSSWDTEGFYKNDKEEHVSDIIEISPYEDFKIDDKVLVWDDEDDKVKAYFAGVNKNGFPTAWCDGRTSFTETESLSWYHCIKYEENND
jgi:hypothetical protein